jgi:hypothetical protein
MTPRRRTKQNTDPRCTYVPTRVKSCFLILFHNFLEVLPPTTTTTTTTTVSTTEIILPPPTRRPRRKNRKRNRKRQREQNGGQHHPEDAEEESDDMENEGEETVFEEVNHISFTINEGKGNKSRVKLKHNSQ